MTAGLRWGKVANIVNTKLENPWKVSDIIELQSDGTLVGCSLSTHLIEHWNPTTGEKIASDRFAGSSRTYNSYHILRLLEWSQGIVIASCNDECLRIWFDNVASTHRHSLPIVVKTGDVSWAILKLESNDGNNELSSVLLCGTDSGPITVWKPVETRRMEMNVKHRLPCLLEDVTIYFDLVDELLGHNDCISDLCQLEDGTALSASNDYTVRRWRVAFSLYRGGERNLDSNSCLQVFSGHTQALLKVIPLLQKNGDNLRTMFATLSSDRTIKVWDTSKEDGKACVTTLQCHNYCVYSFAEISEGLLLCGYSDTTYAVWDYVTQQSVQLFSSDTRGTLSCCVPLRSLKGKVVMVFEGWKFQNPSITINTTLRY